MRLAHLVRLAPCGSMLSRSHRLLAGMHRPGGVPTICKAAFSAAPSLSQIKTLRTLTDAPMKDCKEALAAALAEGLTVGPGGSMARGRYT
jgi:hypothetical protein